MRKCLFSINFGGYDNVKEPYITEGWDYILFTDNPTFRGYEDTAWKVVVLENQVEWSYLMARYVYINSQKFVKDYDFSLMVGGQIKVDGDLNEFCEKYIDFDKDINILKHPCRRCIYSEATAVMNCGKDIAKNVEPQMEYYRDQGFPEGIGLVACGIIGRKSGENIAKHEELWWEQVKTYSHRDQLSFDFIRWKYNLCTYNYIPYNVLFGDYFSIYTHGNNKKVYG